jgi:hypothetical protein
MGGPLPLGYDVRDRLLVINETEATLVRRIFDDFVTVRSATLMAKAYGAQGVVTKGSKPFTKQTIYKMLHNRMYLGEIVHKGQSFPGQHQAIVTQGQWDAVHALIATDGIERRRETNDRQSAPVLLRGLLYTSDGERLVPSYTKKKGKTYRYYSPIKHRRFGAWASSHGALPAVPVEELVTEQILAALSTPHIVQSVWDRMQHIRPDLTEPQVVLPMRNLASQPLAGVVPRRAVPTGAVADRTRGDCRRRAGNHLARSGLAGSGRRVAVRHHRCGIAGVDILPHLRALRSGRGFLFRC